MPVSAIDVCPDGTLVIESHGFVTLYSPSGLRLRDIRMGVELEPVLVTVAAGLAGGDQMCVVDFAAEDSTVIIYIEPLSLSAAKKGRSFDIEDDDFEGVSAVAVDAAGRIACIIRTGNGKPGDRRADGILRVYNAQQEVVREIVLPFMPMVQASSCRFDGLGRLRLLCKLWYGRYEIFTID
eukprot:TRINITY_DN731_c1_g3_i1.p2 TRINITY_DN731_c1_g3~~TRINITY_DN731_c1_g3_i1.p2  ORF type:complete len:181 (+),score=21.19 TRINITY_DN731_c1_g3_i1:324-866(+)